MAGHDDALPATSGTWVIDTDGPDATTAANCAIVGDTLHCDQDDLASGASVSVHVTSGTKRRLRHAQQHRFAPLRPTTARARRRTRSSFNAPT